MHSRCQPALALLWSSSSSGDRHQLSKAWSWSIGTYMAPLLPHVLLQVSNLATCKCLRGGCMQRHLIHQILSLLGNLAWAQGGKSANFNLGF